ncbi:MAG: polysaccharide pyruvyl transferase CsaB [Candidatus Gastranaerophilales bacterium]|nr:polysaccharide pyruvyl transferase CsaB [Candidatus Gastranaerophilales bacterium]MCM1073792.1 polysaccharide pyruvyl transferase CsaB [Bacteroides sp.]
MTKYIVSGYIGFDNFGDEAIASVLTDNLKKIGAEKITLISSNPEKTAKLYGVESTGMFGFIKPIMESDVLVSGGGSLLQDVTSLKSLIYYLGIIMTALFFRKKVIIFAQGFTPFRTKIGKYLTKFVLKRCHKITVRDEKSQMLLKEMGIDSILVPDPVFGIGVNVSEKRGIGLQLRTFPTLTNEFIEKLIAEIRTRFPNQEIKLISLQDSIDLPVLEKIEGKILKNLTVHEALKELSSLEYLVGMRFHACLAAAKAGVKVLGINYDIKVKSLAETIGFPLIELNGEGMQEGFDEMMNTGNYSIPEFRSIFDTEQN